MADVTATFGALSSTEGGNAPAGGTVIGSGLDDNLRMMQAHVAAWRDQIGWGGITLTSVAGANTVTATVATAGSVTFGPTALVANQRFMLTPAGTNTGAVTLNITSPNGGSALTAKNVFSNGLACVGGELRTGVPTLLTYDGTQFNIHSISAPVTAFSKAIYGLTYSNNGSDATNDIDIAVGGAMDATGAYFMRLSSALTKQSDVAWAVGSGNGGLDTGAAGNSDYYIWLIARSDTGVTDILYSLSSTAPTMPANYDFKRLIGWFKRVGGTIVAFHTYETEGGGIELNWDAPTLDVDSSSLTTARLASAVKVPLNFSCLANLRYLFSDVGGAFAILQCPDETDQAPLNSASPGSDVDVQAGITITGRIQLRTSATGTVAARATAAVDTYRLWTVGFRWARRN